MCGSLSEYDSSVLPPTLMGYTEVIVHDDWVNVYLTEPVYSLGRLIQGTEGFQNIERALTSLSRVATTTPAMCAIIEWQYSFLFKVVERGGNAINGLV